MFFVFLVELIFFFKSLWGVKLYIIYYDYNIILIIAYFEVGRVIF